MSDILDATRTQKKYDGIPPYLRMTFNTNDFIGHDDFRSEPSLFANDDSSRSSLSDDASRFSESATTGTTSDSASDVDLTDSDVSSSPSYVSYSNQSLYRTPSPPSYVPGDYHDISLPEALSVSSLIGRSPPPTPDATEASKSLSFSIDSLLGDASQSSDDSYDSAPASVVSNVSAFYPPTNSLLDDASQSSDDTYDSAPASVAFYPPAQPLVENQDSMYASVGQYPAPQQQFIDVQAQPVYSFGMFSEMKTSQMRAVSSTLFWCHVCARFCSSADSAEKHNTMHALVGEKCSLKENIFRQTGYVTLHENTGFLDRVKCGLCDKIVCGRYFVKHVRVHNGHKCEMCAREFSSKGRLIDHKNEHTGELPYACAECPRRFGSRAGLSQHVRRHKNFRSFGCRFCEKRFNTKGACAVHERIHTGNNPYKCDVLNCGRSFPQKVQLDNHILNHV